MALLTEEVTGELREAFAGLVNPVRLVVFSQALAEPLEPLNQEVGGVL